VNIRHGFTSTIERILLEDFGENSASIFDASPLLQYLNIKTRSAARGAKARGAFANHYALYVLVEDYIEQVEQNGMVYATYEGAKFSDLLRRQRELPFGRKLQNHALNGRLNDEFRGMFPAIPLTPILRDSATNRYWINERLLTVGVGEQTINIARSVIRIVDAYVEAKQTAFMTFIEDCEAIIASRNSDPQQALSFVKGLLRPSVDARIFEIVSFAILKEWFNRIEIFWGWSRTTIRADLLTLFKTGRTNANDGGIDFIMKPLGRIFQVTESTDVRKYLLDIDKVQRYPITFVIKSEATPEQLKESIRQQATMYYPVERIAQQYMESIEEIMSIPTLTAFAETIYREGRFAQVLNEIILQSKVEFNYQND
jgi:hypothetical protein